MSNSSSSPERRRTIERLKAASPLDAIYLLADFNRRCWLTKEMPIDLGEVVITQDLAEFEALTLRANALHADEAYFGEKYWTGRADPEIQEEMRRRHPGFGQESYELALHRGIVSMR